MSEAMAPAAPDRRRGRAVLGTCGGAHFLHDGLSDALYVLLPLWAEAFGLSLAQVGALKTVYTASMASFQLPAGFLSERIGERALLAAGTVVSGLAFVLIAFIDGYLALALLLLIGGFGSAVQHPLSSALVARAFEFGRRRAALGTYNFSGDLGKMTAAVSVGLAVAAVGWQGATAGLGVIAVTVAIVLYIALGRLGAGAPPARIPAAERTVARRGWGISNPLGFRAISAIGIVDSAVRYGFLTFVPFLLVEKGARIEAVGLAMALIFGGGAFGKLACGLLAERLGVIRTAVATALGTALGIFLLPFLPLSAALVLLPFAGIALNGTSSVLYGTVADFVASDRQSRAYGLFYTLGIGSGAAAPTVVGLLSDAHGVSVAMFALAAAALATLPACVVLSSAIKREKPA
jgi:MFS family permease